MVKYHNPKQVNNLSILFSLANRKPFSVMGLVEAKESIEVTTPGKSRQNMKLLSLPFAMKLHKP